MAAATRERRNTMGFDPLAPDTRPARIANPYIKWAEDATATLYPYITNLFHQLAQTPPQDVQMRSTFGRLKIDEMLNIPEDIEIEPKHQKDLYKHIMIYREGPCLVIEGTNGTIAQLIAFQSQTSQGVDSIDYVLMYRPLEGKASALQGSYVPPVANTANYTDQRLFLYVQNSALQLKGFIREITWNVEADHSEYQSHVVDGYDLNPYPDDPPDLATAKKTILALHHETFSIDRSPLHKVRYLRIDEIDEHSYIPVQESTENARMLHQQGLFDGYGFTVLGKDMRCTLTISPLPNQRDRSLLLITLEGKDIKGEDVLDTQGVILNTDTESWTDVLHEAVSEATYKL